MIARSILACFPLASGVWVSREYWAHASYWPTIFERRRRWQLHVDVCVLFLGLFFLGVLKAEFKSDRECSAQYRFRALSNRFPLHRPFSLSIRKSESYSIIESKRKENAELFETVERNQWHYGMLLPSSFPLLSLCAYSLHAANSEYSDFRIVLPFPGGGKEKDYRRMYTRSDFRRLVAVHSFSHTSLTQAWLKYPDGWTGFPRPNWLVRAEE